LSKIFLHYNFLSTPEIYNCQKYFYNINFDPYLRYIIVKKIIKNFDPRLQLLPFRVVGVVLTLCLSWLVAKIGLCGLTEDEVHSCLAQRSPWRVKLMKWYAFFGRLVFWSAGEHAEAHS
jgi:hypothetical protein